MVQLAGPIYLAGSYSRFNRMAKVRQRLPCDLRDSDGVIQPTHPIHAADPALNKVTEEKPGASAIVTLRNNLL